MGFYVSQTPRGEMLLGSGIDSQPSYSYRSSYEFTGGCRRWQTIERDTTV